MWRWWMIAVLTVTAVAAGPFEKLPRGHAVYPDLARLNDARLLEHSMVVYEPGQELTRFDVAWLWKAAYDQLAAREGRSLATVTQPDPQVLAVSTAMLHLLDRFETELTRMKVDLVDARLLLERLPRRLTSLKASWSEGADV